MSRAQDVTPVRGRGSVVSPAGGAGGPPSTATVPPAPDSSPFALGLLLRQAHQRIADAMDEVLRPYGIERRHLMVLMHLVADGPLTQRDLVAKTSHDKASMVRIVDDLERLGLASRVPVAGDRRLRAVTMTVQGQEVFARAHQAAAPAAEAATRPLSPRQVTQLRRLLQALATG